MNLIFFSIPTCFLVFFSDFSQSQELTGTNGVVNLDDIQYTLFTRKNIGGEPAILDPNVPGGLNEVITSLKIVIYVTGFSRKNESAADVHLRRAYLAREDVNFIHVDWHNLTKPLWTATANQSTHPVAKHVAGLVDRLVSEYSAKMDNIHMIGFGLGAQIVGISAGYMSHGKVQQIVGLDPTKFSFIDVDISQRLDESDAHFVQVIHTGGRAISYEMTMGHADFYPNGGSSPQPLCSPLNMSFQFFMQPYLLLICSHMMSIIYYIQSIYQPDLFVATQCENWAAASGSRCDGENSTLMGYGADPNTRGIFYINITTFQTFIDSIRNNYPSRHATTTEENKNDQEEKSQSIKPYPVIKPVKQKKYEKFEPKKKYYSKEIIGIDVAQPKNVTTYNEDNMAEDDADDITEVKKTLYTIEEEEEGYEEKDDPANQIEETSKTKGTPLKMVQNQSDVIVMKAGSDIKSKSISALFCMLFLSLIF